jgi:hypothetical protein
MTRRNLAVTISPPSGANELTMRMVLNDTTIRKGEAVNGSLIAQNGTEPYAFSIVSGSLPPGLSLSVGGLITGTPTTVGFYQFLAQVQDSALAEYVCRFAINVFPAFTVTAGDPPDGDVGLAYAYEFKVSGATGTVSWSLSPALTQIGLTIDSSTGILGTGFSTVDNNPSTYNFTVTALDTGSGDSIEIPCSITINYFLDTVTNPVETIPTNVSTVLFTGFTGGTTPYSYAVGATLPAGLTIAFNKDSLYATFLATQSFDSFAIPLTITDAVGATASSTITLTASTLSTDGTLGSASNAEFPTVAAVKTYVDSALAVGPWYGVATNVGNDYSVTIPSYPASYSAGALHFIKIPARSTGAVTLDINGLGPKDIVCSNDGYGPNAPLTSARCVEAGATEMLLYDGTRFQAWSMA